ncbi:ATP synthase subunit I [Oxalobacter paraformigenes]|uniref:ATP synthase subunit I n=1 Tax=Oxalobacter paraformigenes TaxID=556268 RepID=UPI0001A290F2|nr:ATP synthase subunit I [Oxalobacter paraformigenes]
MGRVVAWQLLIAVATAMVTVFIAGKNAGISSILAGLCSVIPNAIFFLGFYIAEKILHKNSPATFFVMEFLKIAISIGLVVLIFWMYREVSWIAFLVSYVVALKSYIFLLSKSKS